MSVDTHTMTRFPGHTLFAAALAGALSFSCDGPSDGFLVEAALCKPDEEAIVRPDASPLTALSPLRVGPTAGGAYYAVSQKTEAIGSAQDLWGIELYLKGAPLANHETHLDIAITADDDLPFPPYTSVMPDGRFGYVARIPTTFSATIPEEFDWVRIRFQAPLAVAGGERLWIGLTNASGDPNTVTQWGFRNTGEARVSAVPSPLYVPVPGFEALHAIIPCHD